MDELSQDHLAKIMMFYKQRSSELELENLKLQLKIQDLLSANKTDS